jgi:ubiquinone/menaquinone biosynthesis C-methylase UbiE/uncharacterized protein YbaR (Trm112 family)
MVSADRRDARPDVSRIMACPVCKGPLNVAPGALQCPRCRVSYPVIDGIPRLLAPAAPPALDPNLIHVKTREEAVRTLAARARIESGFIAAPRWFYGLYLILILAIFFRAPLAVGVVLALLLADWIVYRARRGRVLAAYERDPLRMRTAADAEVVDQAFEKLHQAPPSMEDCIRLLAEASGAGGSEEQWKPLAAERYLDILKVLESLPGAAQVVVDVGANNGQACWEYGIGRGRTYIGIDVDRPLLAELKRRLPDQIAIQADGSSLPLADASADFLFCTETLEHIPDPKAAVREFVRVLKPGGCFVVQSPNAHRMRNLNPFEIVTIALSLIDDRVLQPKVVHENTWVNVTSYHWDFSIQHFGRMLAGSPARVQWRGSREFFFPLFLLRGSLPRYRQKEHALRAFPIVRYFGADLMIVVRNNPADASSSAPAAY